MSTIAYEFEGNIYINLTNRCSNACVFCLRENGDGIGGHNLWLDKEPSADEVISRLKEMNLKNAREVVFCGFGEPTYKVEEIVTIAEFLKQEGKLVRLDTNGSGNLINNTDITPILEGRIDKVSISLNASNASEYQRICNSEFGESAFFALIDFAKKCKDRGIDTQFSVVDTIGQQEIEKCLTLASNEEIRLRVREYIR